MRPNLEALSCWFPALITVRPSLGVQHHLRVELTLMRTLRLMNIFLPLSLITVWLLLLAIKKKKKKKGTADTKAR